MTFHTGKFINSDVRPHSPYAYVFHRQSLLGTHLHVQVAPIFYDPKGLDRKNRGLQYCTTQSEIDPFGG
jgi:hypothetical protein